MTRRRTGLAATAVGLALAALPAAAQAHPVDCPGSTSMATAPSGERYVDWGGGSDGCVTVGTEQVARDGSGSGKVAPPRRRPAQGLVPAGRPRAAAQPRHERRDRRARRLRVHRQPHRRRPRRPAAGRADGGRRLQAAEPTLLGRAVRRQAGRVHARAARVALEGHADRAQHQLRRRADAAPLHGAVDQQHPLLRHRRARTPSARTCCTSSRSTRTSSSSGWTRRTRTGR